MSEQALEVTCRRRSGHWEVTIPDGRGEPLLVERLEDVPHAVQVALAGAAGEPSMVRVLLDVHGC
jgi:hypothetical protein